jgi:hypothetical protein
MVVPHEYSESHFLISFLKTFYKTKLISAKKRPSQLSMTVDTAIWIDLHSVEVVHFTHKIQYIHHDQPWIVIHKYAEFG